MFQQLGKKAAAGAISPIVARELAAEERRQKKQALVARLLVFGRDSQVQLAPLGRVVAGRPADAETFKTGDLVGRRYQESNRRAAAIELMVVKRKLEPMPFGNEPQARPASARSPRRSSPEPQSGPPEASG